MCQCFQPHLHTEFVWYMVLGILWWCVKTKSSSLYISCLLSYSRHPYLSNKQSYCVEQIVTRPLQKLLRFPSPCYTRVIICLTQPDFAILASGAVTKQIKSCQIQQWGKPVCSNGYTVVKLVKSVAGLLYMCVDRLSSPR